jgi:glycosyltransferase involved in cell wall biosynthesis
MVHKIIINFWQPYTAIYRYVQLLNGLPNTQVINIIDDQAKWIIPHSGKDFNGKYNNSKFNVLFPFRSHRDAINYLKSLRYDDVVFHYTSQRDILFYNSKSVLFTVHDNPFAQFKSNLYYNNQGLAERLSKKLEKHIFNKYAMKSETITVNTNHVKKFLIKWGYKGRISVINLPVSESFYPIKEDKSDIRKELNLPINKILILSVSNNVYRKNLETVRKLNDLLSDKYAIIRVGISIGNQISYQNVDDALLNKLYNACDVLLFPTLEEGQGLPIIEAFKTGLPVVASDIDVLKEVTNNNAAFADPFNVHSIYKAIQEAMNRKKELSRNGIEEAKKYSFDIFKSKMEALYESIYRKK